MVQNVGVVIVVVIVVVGLVGYKFGEYYCVKYLIGCEICLYLFMRKKQFNICMIFGKLGMFIQILFWIVLIKFGSNLQLSM